MGERDYLITLEMASLGMEMAANWGPQAVSERLRFLTDHAANALADCPGLEIPKKRAPNILSLSFSDGLNAPLIESLACQGIHVANRLGRLRVGPHVYNDEADMDRFASALVSQMTSQR